MESNYSSLREVLNNIASIQHELANDQTQMLDSDILMQLKGLAAKLYLESDIELLSMSFVDDEISAVAQAPEVVPAFIPDVDQVADAVPEVINVPIVESVPESVVPVVDLPEISIVAPENVSVPAIEEPAAVEMPPVVEVSLGEVEAPEVVISEVQVPEEVIVPEVALPAVDVVAPVVETVAAEVPVSMGLTVESVIGQMPLSRRFEFSNILFGGNMEKMGMFIQQIIDAPNAAGRLDVYDRWYEECQWRRRDESASDMLRMIKRIFAS
jgi:hypothetical protein